MTRTALLMFGASVMVGCGTQGPLGTVGAIVTAPITAPVMFLSVRMNDWEDHVERARRNDRPLPPIDANSRAMARATLEEALERGTIDEGLHWRNEEDASGYAAGGFTVLASGRTDDGRPCREVLIETAMERRPTDRRVRTYCRAGTGWNMVAFMAAAPEVPSSAARLTSKTSRSSPPSSNAVNPSPGIEFVPGVGPSTPISRKQWFSAIGLSASSQRVCEVCDHGAGDPANAAFGQVSARPCTW